MHGAFSTRQGVCPFSNVSERNYNFAKQSRHQQGQQVFLSGGKWQSCFVIGSTSTLCWVMFQPCKALRFDGSFAPAWVAYGHSFAHHDESDQALAALLGQSGWR